MLSNIISTLTASTPSRTSGRNIEASSNNSNSNDSDEKNADEPPPDSSVHNNNSSNNNKHGFHNKCESLDEGTFAFMHWMNSENKKSITSDNPIVLLKFVNDRHTILYDTDLHSEVDVQINEGVPYCKYCKLDDCSHVGFAVCLEELYGHRRGRGKEETVDDIISEN
ncbi:MAG: hypothetical protein ACJ71G_05270 [Nitrososphaeraceae archaeon]|jgi:hypothetical protein